MWEVSKKPTGTVAGDARGAPATQPGTYVFRPTNERIQIEALAAVPSSADPPILFMGLLTGFDAVGLSVQPTNPTGGRVK